MAGKKGFSGWLWRIVATIILIPVILLILTAILLAIPPIQQKAVAIATGYLSDATTGFMRHWPCTKQLILRRRKLKESES